jgi:hypothetical protein
MYDVADFQIAFFFSFPNLILMIITPHFKNICSTKLNIEIQVWHVVWIAVISSTFAIYSFMSYVT